MRKLRADALAEVFDLVEATRQLVFAARSFLKKCFARAAVLVVELFDVLLYLLRFAARRFDDFVFLGECVKIEVRNLVTYALSLGCYFMKQQ